MVQGNLPLVAILAGLASMAIGKPHPLDNNMVYRSIFSNYPEFARDTAEIHARHAKRQLEDASPFADEHYGSFYGSDFSNAAQVWAAGIDFTHSVASGDPFDTSVILWTRAFPKASTVASNPSSTPFLPDQSIPVCVRFEIATDKQFKDVKDSGDAFTTYDVDFTVKVEAQNLTPETPYFYRFMDCTNNAATSPVGNTRTIPSADTPANKVNGGKALVFGVFSCSQFQAGYFNAYGYAVKNTKADFFIHVGDYIYETPGNGAPIGRTTLGRELATIFDYRQRYAQYRTDVSLSLIHQKLPVIHAWDDHEVADNTWKAGSTDSNDTLAGCTFSPSGACFTDRKLAAVRAYHEWMPTRVVDTDDLLRIWRNFQFGKLLDLTMIDTRQYDRDVTGIGYNAVIKMHSLDPQRSMMGPKQENWFYDTLRTSKNRGAIWRVVGQQVVFAQLNETGNPGGLSTDNWSGYKANRERFLNHLHDDAIDNTVVLAGDSHDNWVSDLPHPNSTLYDPATGAGSLGVEFAGTAVTSGNNFALGTSSTAASADALCSKLVVALGNEQLQWCEHSFRGFFTITVTPKLLTATYYAMSNISTPNTDGFASATFTVHPGKNMLDRPVAGGVVKAGILKAHILNTTTSAVPSVSMTASAVSTAGSTPSASATVSGSMSPPA